MPRKHTSKANEAHKSSNRRRVMKIPNGGRYASERLRLYTSPSVQNNLKKTHRSRRPWKSSQSLARPNVSTERTLCSLTTRETKATTKKVADITGVQKETGSPTELLDRLQPIIQRVGALSFSRKTRSQSEFAVNSRPTANNAASEPVANNRQRRSKV